MRKLSFIALASIILVSCSEVENPNANLGNNDIGTIFKITQSTDQIGILSQFQVSQINVENKDNSTNYSFESNSTLRIEGTDFNLSSLNFKLADGKFFMEGQEESNFIYLKNNLPFIFHEGNEFELSKYSKDFNSSQLEILLLAYFELTSPSISRIKGIENSENMLRAPCSLTGTYYLTAVNISNSSAVAELQDAIESGQYNAGCGLIGGIDVSCVTDSHMCVATQAYCCD